MNVHNHGTQEGEGLFCKEHLIGKCIAKGLWLEIPARETVKGDIQCRYYNGNYETVIYLRPYLATLEGDNQ